MTGQSEEKKSRKKRSISSFTILIIMLVVLALVTIIVAASGAEGVTGATFYNVATAPILGFVDAIDVCLFVLILGGFLGIITETGALDAGITALVKKLKGNELILIPILMFIFSIGGTTYGMCEETVPFYLLLAATMVAAGFDSIVGAATVLLGAGTGVLGSTVNPFAVGAAVASLPDGIEVNQGIIILLGVILWLSTLAISIIFVMRYAKKVKANKGSTILTLQEQETMKEEFGEENIEDANDGSFVGKDGKKRYLSGRQKASLIVFGLTFVIMITGFIPWEDFNVNVFNAGSVTEEFSDGFASDKLIEGEISGIYDDGSEEGMPISGELSVSPNEEADEIIATWEEETSLGWSSLITGVPLGQWYFNEASTWFLLAALLIGIIGGVGESRFVKAFIAGAADMMSVVLIIAVARSITILMGETGLDIFILENAAAALQGVVAAVFAPLSFLLYIVLSFLIPSSSGMATVTMPIMGGLADRLDFSVETMIMIFSAGSGLVNLFTPTSGAIMGGLALAKIEYTTWLKFGAKLFVVLGVVCAVILTVAMVILS